MEMQPSKSSIVSIVVSVIVAAIIFGSLGYYLATNKNQTVQTATSLTPSASLALTKTYTSSKYNFSVNYPAEWKATEESWGVHMGPETEEGPICESCSIGASVMYRNSVKDLPVYNHETGVAGTTKQTTLLDYLKNESGTIFGYEPVKVGSHDGYFTSQSDSASYFVEDAQGHIYELMIRSTDPNAEAAFLASFKLTK